MDWFMFSLIGYAVILGGLLAWEALGLRDRRDAWPTITELVRGLPIPFRSVVVGLCAWMAGHFAGIGEGIALGVGLCVGAATFGFLSRDE